MEEGKKVKWKEMRGRKSAGIYFLNKYYSYSPYLARKESNSLQTKFTPTRISASLFSNMNLTVSLIRA